MKHIFSTFLLVVSLAVTPLSLSAQSVSYHVVEAGQTVYSIARQYGVSPKDILKLNPKAEESLHPGDKLTLPKGAQLGKANIAGSKYKEMYEVQKKDNLYRIALNYGLTTDELLAANPDLTIDSKLKKGSFICIPYTKAEQESARKAAAEQAAAARKAYLSVPHPIKSINAAVILPFKSGDSRASRMLEFYSGMLIAADSVKSEGTEVKLSAYQSGTTAEEINKVISSGDLEKMNIVFGPLDQVQAKPLSDYCKKHNIRLVMPFATTGTTGIENSTTYVVTDEQDDVQLRAARLAFNQLGKANYIFVNCSNSDERGRGYVSALMKTLQGSEAAIQNVQMDASAAEFAAAFSSSKRNVVVLNSIREANLTKLSAKLDAVKASAESLNISLLGYPDWVTFKKEAQNAMFRYEARIYSTFYRNTSLKALKSVEAHYQKKFGKEMANTTPRFGLLGFDLGYYFLHGVAALGESFDNLQNTLSYNYLQHRFNFQQSGANRGFINQHVYLVVYKPNKQIELHD